MRNAACVDTPCILVLRTLGVHEASAFRPSFKVTASFGSMLLPRASKSRELRNTWRASGGSQLLATLNQQWSIVGYLLFPATWLSRSARSQTKGSNYGLGSIFLKDFGKLWVRWEVTVGIQGALRGILEVRDNSKMPKTMDPILATQRLECSSFLGSILSRK